MFQMIGYILMIYIGLWIARRSCQQPKKETQLKTKPAIKSETKPSPDPRIEALEYALKNARDANELDKKIAEDALAREMRSKAALSALMRLNGCTDEQIEEVFQTLDNRSKGDL